MRTFEDRQLFWAVLPKVWDHHHQIEKTSLPSLSIHSWLGFVFVLHKMCELPKLWRVWETAEPPVIELPPDFFFFCFASPPIICHTCSQYSYIFTDLSGRRPRWCHSQNRRGKLATNCSTSQSFQFHVIKSNHLHWLYSYISTYLSGYRSFWAMGQVAQKSHNPISPFISYRLQSSVTLARHILTYSMEHSGGKGGEWWKLPKNYPMPISLPLWRECGPHWAPD